MKQKTLQIISDAISFKPDTFIITESGTQIGIADTLKLFGFTLGTRSTCHAHPATIKKSFRDRYWILINLKVQKFTKGDLVHIYKTCIQPVSEYCSEVFHSMLMDSQDEEIEKIHLQDGVLV